MWRVTQKETYRKERQHCKACRKACRKYFQGARQGPAASLVSVLLHCKLVETS